MTNKTKFSSEEKSLFFSVLKKRIEAYFVQNQISKYANRTMVIKTIVMLSLYIVPFIVLVVLHPSGGVSALLWLLMGFGVAGIGMNVMHDANHGAYSKRGWVNKWLGYSIYLAGGGVANWKWQHNLLHHTYTNIVPLDEDIKDRVVVKLSPHGKVGSFHQFQWIHAFFFYSFMTLYWVIAKDFVQYVSFIKMGVNTQTKEQNGVFLAKLILLKMLYIGVLWGVPMYWSNMSFGEVLGGFMLMHLSAGLVLTLTFQLAHSVEGTTHPIISEDNTIAKDWAIHQLETTVNFAPKNVYLSWYMGGLNFQIEHHLFPKICHVHYPAIAPIVRQTAEEFGLTYMEHPSFVKALGSHINMLKRFGKLPSPEEAIG